MLKIVAWFTVLLLAGWVDAATIPTLPSSDFNISALNPPPAKKPIGCFRFGIDKDEVFFDTKVIPEDHQVAAFLYKGESKLFFFLNEREASTLVVAVTPCTSSIEWSVRFRPQNLTGMLDNSTGSGEEELKTFRGIQQQSFRETEARRGLYVVRVRALERETYVHFYASRLEQLHENNSYLSESNLRVSTKQQRRKLVMRWEPSSVDPHLMHYCIVVNTRRDYPSLCAANGDLNGVSPPQYPTRGGFDFPRDRQESQKSELANKAARRQAGSNQPIFDDIVVGCVGKKTHYALGGLQHGKVYYINLFATNKKTNLSFPYGSTTVKYDKKQPKPLGLRDGKLSSVNFRQLDGLATFKFKVINGVKEAQFFVLPCGGGVDAEILMGKEIIVKSTRVDSIGKLRVKNPKPGRYVVRVTSTDSEELQKVESLQVMASSREISPLPELPAPAVLHEYHSLRSCNSITLGWLPSPDPLVSRYCLLVRDQTRHKQIFYKKPNQCHVIDGNTKHKDSATIVSSYCLDLPYNTTRLVHTRRIANLRPGRLYTIQLTVRRPKGRALSYDLVQTSTKTSCPSS